MIFGRKPGLHHGERAVNWAWPFCSVVQRFPRRGGNYNNGGNIGLGYENCNNPRGNANRNYGTRPRSQQHQKGLTITHRGHSICLGGARSLPGSTR